MDFFFKERDFVEQKFTDLQPGDVFRRPNGGKLLIKVRYFMGGGISGDLEQYYPGTKQADDTKYADHADLAVYMHNGYMTVPDTAGFVPGNVVKVRGGFQIEPADLTSMMANKNFNIFRR